VVFNHPELSPPSTTVDASGDIAVPLAGVVDAQGATSTVLAERIRLRLLPYIPLVAVDVRVLEQGTDIFVSGDVGGVLKYSPGETLVAALQDESTNNGASPAAPAGAAVDLRHGPIDLQDVGIIRDGAALGPYDVEAMIAQGEAGPPLDPGDTLVLKDKAIRIPVRGDVKVPGFAYLDPAEPLLQAIAQVGGPLETAWTSHVQLTRDGTTQTVPLGDPLFSEPSHPGDALLVPRAPTVSVLGLVVKPGTTVLHGDATLLDALYEAGGPTSNGNLRSVTVLRKGQRSEYDVANLTHGAHDQNPTLSDGDTVFVPEGHKFDFTFFFQALASAWVIHSW
jgi:protein involved in polysaccharide export with SLBB domain